MPPAAMLWKLIGEKNPAVIRSNDDRLGCAPGFGNGLMERAGREPAAINGNKAHPRSEPCIRRRHSGYNVRQSSIFFSAGNLHHDTEREAEIKRLVDALAHARDRIFLIVIDQLPATVLNSSERRVRIDFIDAGVEKTAPVVGESCIESGDDIIESVGQKLGTRGGRAIKSPAENIEGFLSLRFLANQDVRIQPN